MTEEPAKAPVDVSGAIPFDLPRVTPRARERALRIFESLRARYPDARCELDYSTPHELLIATILSAQSTDAGVNKTTPALFRAFPTPAHYAAAEPADVEAYIKTIGLFRNKARAVVSAMRTILDRFGGEVPRTMDGLLELRGVARKTANVVLGNAFGINVGVVVDTHVERLAKRFALVPQSANVQAVERRLMALFAREHWWLVPHLFIFHGRRVCKARGGSCANDEICLEFCSNARMTLPPRTTRQTRPTRPTRPRG